MSAPWSALKRYLIDHTGLAFYEERESQLVRAVEPRIRDLQLEGPEAYLDLLEHSPAEVDAITARLTVGETYFFRDRAQLRAISDTIFPTLRPGARVWSAGCAVGAEPYSLSCLAWRHFGAALDLLATDINRRALETARHGVYSEWALREVTREERDLYFTRQNDAWRLNPQPRTGVRFEYHNLVKDPIPPEPRPFDMIVCRNVLIYFSAEQIRKILDGFYESLAAEGWLVVGHSEPNLELFRRFTTIPLPGTVVYRKGAQAPVTAPTSPAAREPGVPRPARRLSASRSADEVGPTLEKLKALADRGRWQEARRMAEELITLDPLQAKAHFYRALVAQQLGLAEESERAYRQAIYLDRSDPLPHYYRGLAQGERGEKEEAARSLRTVVRLLASTDSAQTFPELDDITAADLLKVVTGQLEDL